MLGLMIIEAYKLIFIQCLIMLNVFFFIFWF
jgi:hypothetical protein